MKYSSLLILAGVVAFSACKNGKNAPKSSKEVLEQAASQMNAGVGKFTIDAPAGWRKVDTTLSGIKTTFILSPATVSGFRPNINVVSEKMGQNDLQQYADKTKETMGKYMAGFNVLGEGDKDVNGLPAKWLKYSSSQNGNELVALLYIVPKNGIAYLITGITRVGDEERLPVFTNAVATFKVTE